MYVITTITLQDLQGNEDDYEVGAEVNFSPGDNGWVDSYEVGEPDVSAPGSTLKLSRLAVDPQVPGYFPVGWSRLLEDALIETYTSSQDEPCDLDPDEYYDRDHDTYTYEEY